MALPAWHGTSWPTRREEDYTHQKVRSAALCDDLEESSPGGMSDAEQSSAALRKRGCEELQEMSSSVVCSWDNSEGQASHGLKRVCSALTTSCCNTSGGAASHQLEPCSSDDPSSGGPLSPNSDSHLIRPATPSGGTAAGSTAAAANQDAAAAAAPAAMAVDHSSSSRRTSESLGTGSAAASDTAAAGAGAAPTGLTITTARAIRNTNSLPAGTWQLSTGEELRLNQKPVTPADAAAAAGASSAAAGKACQAQTGAVRTSRSSASKAGQQQPAAGTLTRASAAACKRASSKKAADSASQKQHSTRGASKQGKHSQRHSSSGSSSSSCKGPRVRLGGRLLSPEEAERYLKEAAAAAQAAAAKALAAKAVAATPPAAAGGDAAAGIPAVAAATAGGGCSRAASPTLGQGSAAVTAPSTAANGAAGCSSGSTQLQQLKVLLSSPQCSITECRLSEHVMSSSTAAGAAGVASLACTAQCTAQCPAGMDSLDCADLAMPDQLPDDFIPTPNQLSWPSLEATLEPLDESAAAADAVFVGSAGSAAGGSALAAAAAEPEPAVMYMSPFVVCPSRLSGVPAVMSSTGLAAMQDSMAMGRQASAPVQLSPAAAAFNISRSYSSYSSYSSYNSCGSTASRLVPEASLGRAASQPGLTVSLSGLSGPSGLQPTLMSSSLSSMATPAAAPAPAAAAVKQEEKTYDEDEAVDTELQQLLQSWSPAAEAATETVAAVHQQVFGMPAARVGFSIGGQQQQQQAPIAWRSAFAPVAGAGAAGAQLMVPTPAAAAPAAVLPAGNTSSAARPFAPRARKSKPINIIRQQQPHHVTQQQQVLQLPAGMLSQQQGNTLQAQQSQQQQDLLAMVDQLVQQRLAQSYEAGFLAAAQINGTGSTVQSSSNTAAAAAAAAAMQSADMAGVGAGGAAGLPAGFQIAATGAVGMGEQQVLLPVPRNNQMVDDILPSMQDLLTDCC